MVPSIKGKLNHRIQIQLQEITSQVVVITVIPREVSCNAVLDSSTIGSDVPQFTPLRGSTVTTLEFQHLRLVFLGTCMIFREGNVLLFLCFEGCWAHLQGSISNTKLALILKIVTCAVQSAGRKHVYNRSVTLRWLYQHFSLL